MKSLARPVETAAPGPSRLAASLVAAATLAAFWPVLSNGFVNWDDPENLLLNPRWRGFGPTELRWMFTTSVMGHFQPLTWLSFALDHSLWRLDPFGYHLTSLLLHAANAVLLCLISRRLLAAALGPGRELSWPAAFAALAFAVHPLRVEAVAWATERREVLSALFYLLAVLAHLKAVSGEGRPWRFVSIGAFGLSLLSKAAGMTLPLALLVLDVYPLRRLPGEPGRWRALDHRPVLREKLPYALLALAAMAGLAWGMTREGILLPVASHGLGARLGGAAHGTAFYLWKTIWPADLLPLYERPSSISAMTVPFALGAAVAVVLTAGFARLWPRRPMWLAAWAFYLLTLSPMLGLVAGGPQLVADRYSYLACLGWAVLAGAGLEALRSRLGGAAAGLAGLSLAAGLGALTWRQCLVWRESETLWRHVLASRPETVLAHNGLGMALAARGDLDGAEAQYREASRLDPRFGPPRVNLGRLLAARGRREEALAAFREAVGADPADANARYNLGLALAGRGRHEEAAAAYREALALPPGAVAWSAAVWNELGVSSYALGRYGEAVESYREAVRLDPGSAAAHNNLGNALAALGRYAEAVPSYERGLALSPGYAEAHANLGMLLALRGDFEGARRHCEEARRLKPGDPGVERVYANVLEHERRAGRR